MLCFAKRLGTTCSVRLASAEGSVGVVGAWNQKVVIVIPLNLATLFGFTRVFLCSIYFESKPVHIGERLILNNEKFHTHRFYVLFILYILYRVKIYMYRCINKGNVNCAACFGAIQCSFSPPPNPTVHMSTTVHKAT